MWFYVCLKLYVKYTCKAVNHSKIQCVCTGSRGQYLEVYVTS